MADAESIEEMNLRKDKAITLSNKLKHQIHNLKGLNLSHQFDNEIDSVIKDLVSNVHNTDELLTTFFHVNEKYNHSYLKMHESSEAIRDLSSIMKINSNAALLDKIRSTNQKPNKSDFERLFKEELHDKELSSEIINRIGEIKNSLQILNNASNNEIILDSEQGFDHALRIITRAIVNHSDKSVRKQFSPYVLMLIQYGQDDEDIFNLKQKIINFNNKIHLISKKNLQLAQRLNITVNSISDEVKVNTEISAFSLKDIISSGKIILYIVIIFASSAGILLTLTTVRRVTRPLSKLVSATKEIGDGNLNHEIEIETNDEFGELAKSFNLMTTNLKNSKDKIEYLAYHDTLTGLPNRRLFNKYLNSAILEADNNSENIAIMFLDLDNFKRINDTLGHNVGDELLKVVSQRITSCIRSSDSDNQNIRSDSTISRVGGDEFILLFTHLNNSFEPSTIANRILKIFESPFEINGESIHTNTSIGIAVYPDDTRDADELVKFADIAMYEAKDSGKGIYQYYSNSMNTAILRILSLQNKLHNAIIENQLELHYQPIIDAHNHEIVGAEALIRWHDPELGIIYPDAFIPLAEESGAIIPIGKWVIEEACKKIKSWNTKFNTSLFISINVSSVQFSKQNICELISHQIKSNDINPEFLHIEITESILMSSINEVADKLMDLKKLGIKISLDDFGTGYSSLSYLQKFPIDTLKIDRQFTSEITEIDELPPLVTAIINMAHGLDMDVVAEGVENEFQATQLKKLSCKLLQGYYFSRPVVEAEMTELIRKSYLKSA
ncbi:MAG: EAL domain-containing protein [Gammaproteobacteria bacterium]